MGSQRSLVRHPKPLSTRTQKMAFPRVSARGSLPLGDGTASSRKTLKTGVKRQTLLVQALSSECGKPRAYSWSSDGNLAN